MKEYQKKLLVIAKNNIKKGIHIGTLKVRDICNNLKSRTSKEDFLLMQQTNEKWREKELMKKKNHVLTNFNELKENVNKEKVLSFLLRNN